MGNECCCGPAGSTFSSKGNLGLTSHPNDIAIRVKYIAKMYNGITRVTHSGFATLQLSGFSVFIRLSN